MATEESEPVQALETRVIQGYLEQSNVVCQEMTELIMAQRAYQLTQGGTGC